MITSSTISRFIPTILCGVTRLPTNVTNDLFLFGNGRLVLLMNNALPRSVAQLSLGAVRNSSADLATSSRSASLLSRRYVDKSAGLESRNCSFTNRSLRASYVCGASASFIHRSKYVLRRTMNMLGFSPSSGEQVRNRCLYPSSVRLYLFCRTSLTRS